MQKLHNLCIKTGEYSYKEAILDDFSKRTTKESPKATDFFHLSALGESYQ